MKWTSAIEFLIAIVILTLHQQGLAFSPATTSTKKKDQTENSEEPRQETCIEETNNPVHTLLLCRHGDSIWNGGEPGMPETFTGWTDVPLSRKGVREAKRLGQELLQRWGSGIDACFTSTLQRAQMTAHYCCWAFGESPLDKEIGQFVIDYRLNERHYGTLQGYSKRDVQNGRYGHGSSTVQLWRRSWNARPPLLSYEDTRREKEVAKFINICGGDENNIPRGESLSDVAKNRIQPFVHQILIPTLEKNLLGGTGLIVAHANSLRALIGVLCNVEEDPVALKSLERLQIPTGVPLILKFQSQEDEGICLCDLNGIPYAKNEKESGLQVTKNQQPDLPVWPLSCIPLARN